MKALVIVFLLLIIYTLHQMVEERSKEGFNPAMEQDFICAVNELDQGEIDVPLEVTGNLVVTGKVYFHDYLLLNQASGTDEQRDAPTHPSVNHYLSNTFKNRYGVQYDNAQSLNEDNNLSSVVVLAGLSHSSKPQWYAYNLAGDPIEFTDHL